MRIRTHPGEVLREEFMKPLGISQNKLARDLDIPPSRVSGLVKEVREVTPDTAIRLGAYFKTTPEFWLNLQQAHTLSKVKAECGEAIVRAVRPRQHAAHDAA